MLRSLSPDLAAFELRCLLAALAGMDTGGSGKVSLAALKQAAAALTFAQAYPVSLDSLHAGGLR